MMKKLVVLNGSPHRHGNTRALVDEVLKAAFRKDAQVKIYDLNTMKISGCQSCRVCKKQGQCVIMDDMQPIYNDINEADGIIFATPVYMWQMSAQLKLAVDRLFPYLKEDYSSYLSPHKKVLIIATQARPDTTLFHQYFDYVCKNLSFLGFGTYKILIAGGLNKPENLSEQPQVISEARQVGEWILSES